MRISVAHPNPIEIGQRFWRWCEFVVGFVLLPLAIGTWVRPVWWVPTLWIVALVANWHLRRDPTYRSEKFLESWRSPATKHELRRMVTGFVVACVLLLLFVWLRMPERLLDFPRERTALWLAIMALYPALSVWAQEFLYRRYFFHRFSVLFGSERTLVLASAVAFAGLHLIFRNAVAVILTFIGGWLFAETYRRTRSLGLTCIEHALYGDLIFTVGLGEFFFHGAVRG